MSVLRNQSHLLKTLTVFPEAPTSNGRIEARTDAQNPVDSVSNASSACLEHQDCQIRKIASKIPPVCSNEAVTVDLRMCRDQKIGN